MLLRKKVVQLNNSNSQGNFLQLYTSSMSARKLLNRTEKGYGKGQSIQFQEILL